MPALMIGLSPWSVRFHWMFDALVKVGMIVRAIKLVVLKWGAAAAGSFGDSEKLKKLECLAPHFTMGGGKIFVRKQPHCGVLIPSYEW